MTPPPAFYDALAVVVDGRSRSSSSPTRRRARRRSPDGIVQRFATDENEPRARRPVGFRCGSPLGEDLKEGLTTTAASRCSSPTDEQENPIGVLFDVAATSTAFRPAAITFSRGSAPAAATRRRWPATPGRRHRGHQRERGREVEGTTASVVAVSPDGSVTITKPTWEPRSSGGRPQDHAAGVRLPRDGEGAALPAVRLGRRRLIRSARRPLPPLQRLQRDLDKPLYAHDSRAAYSSRPSKRASTRPGSRRAAGATATRTRPLDAEVQTRWPNPRVKRSPRYSVAGPGAADGGGRRQVLAAVPGSLRNGDQTSTATDGRPPSRAHHLPPMPGPTWARSGSCASTTDRTT